MAITEIRAGKASPGQALLTLVRGDESTHTVRFNVQRHFGGVDLSSLAWSVTVENAAGATDEHMLSAIRGENAIEMEWIPGGTATAVPGITKFKLSGFGEDGKTLVWQSGTYHIRVEDTFSHTPGSETAAELTGVQKLIIYVDGELNKVIKAGTDAAEAAKAANKAADRANSVADGKNEGRITALEQFTTKPGEPYAVEGKLVQLDNFEGMPMNAVTRIEPVQAGSGDPYPGGGGKNLVSESSAKGALSAYTKVLHIKSELMPNTTYTLSFVASQAGNNLYLNEHISARQYLTTTGKLQSITFTTAEEVAKNNAAQYDTELGWIVFKNGITNVEPVTFSDVQLELGSTATAYVPYANIRPISGHTGAKLTKCGKNLAEQIVYGYVTLDGNNVYVRIDNNSTSVIAGVVEGNEYTISCSATLDRFGVGKLEAANPTNGALLTGYRFYGNQSSAHELHFTAEFTGTAFIYLKSTKDETAKDSLQVEIGSVATEYTPYQGETFTANFGQNVYGGTLDWGKGVLTVDRAIVTLTGTENSVERNTTENAHYIRYNYFGLTQSAIADGAFCSHFKTRLNTDVGDQLTNTFEIHSSILYPIFRVSASLYPTDDVWKSYLAAQKAAGTPVQVCYKLATPTTIQLTPAQLTALQGMNNIFCDAGETTVSGRKDILWLTSGLIEQIDTLKKAIISLGGNV